MRRTPLSSLIIAAVLITGCAGDDTEDATSVTVAGATTADTAAGTTPGATTAGVPTSAGTSGSTAAGGSASAPSGAVPDVVAGAPFPAGRCEANREAGTITYLTGFDFAAAAGMVDVFVADQAGYYEDLCLDVELQPSFSVDNYPFIASGDAQFASGGSFSEVVNYAAANEADLVAVDVEGRVAIDSLILKPGTAAGGLGDLAGTTIGVKGALPPSIAAMLATAGLTEGEDYDTVLLDGYDPAVHIGLDGIVGFPGYRSNEPGQLTRAGIDFDLYEPADFGVPGSFGVIITSRQFIEDHPTAAQDFLRATMRGLADAMADPAAASDVAVAMVDANGNPNFLSPEGEAYRWETEAGILRDETPAGTGVGVPDPELLQAEVEAYATVGLFGGEVPDIAGRYDSDLLASVYDGDQVIWPQV